MEGNFNLILAVLLLPLIGSAVQALFGKMAVKSLGPKWGKWLMGFLAVLPIAAAFGIGATLALKMMNMDPAQRHIQIQFSEWITLLNFHVPFEVLIDPLSITMVLIITGIGALIHLYATGYMSEERDYPRFFTYLNLFIACMLILVLGNNLALLFIGWEGVGLCSYLLIGFWYKDLANARAANKAFIVNRIGDWGMSLGMFLVVVLIGINADKLHLSDPRYLSYDVILPNIQKIVQANSPMAATIALLFFVGACGKSAQFPLYLWLPDAMAGPTPVSALIHAATMVTSGVVLLNRLHIFFEMSQLASAIVCAVGAFTAVFAALIAFGQTDIKKVLAYSTVSQLGYMFIGCGAGAYYSGMFHVTTHAFFKALLFLGAGAVIHAMAHDQDMRNYGKLAKYIKITCATMLIGWLAIAGVPGLSGFYSKESIIGAALAGDHAVINGFNVGYYAGWFALFGALLTAFYMTRMTMLTFFGKTERWRLIEDHHGHGHDAHPVHAHHSHAHAHGHGEDVHNFFYTDAEMDARDAAEVEEEHHALDAEHKPHEVPVSMWFPLVVLAGLAAVGGYFMEQNEAFQKWLYPEPLPILGEVKVHPEGLPLPLMTLSLIAAGGGILLGLIFYWKGLPNKEGWDYRKWSPFRIWAKNQFGYDVAMSSMAIDGGGDISRATWRGLDVHGIDGLVNDAGYITGGLGQVLRKIQTGFVRSYALMMLLGGVVLIAALSFAYHSGTVVR